jgi:hypothetical protein
MKISYALLLAKTKLRSKRGMLFASVAVASLLFAALIALVIVFNGVQQSADAFIKKAGNDRYLVRTQPNLPSDKISLPFEPTIEDIRMVKAYEKEYYAKEKRKFQAAGIPYDPSNEVSALVPASWKSESLPEELRVIYNYESPVIAELNNQRMVDYMKTATNKIGDLKKTGERYGASGYYLIEQPTKLESLPASRLVVDGKEDFSASEMKSGDMSTFGYYTNGMFNSTYSFMADATLSRYLLNKDGRDLKGIPVVVSAQEAAKLYGKNVGIGEEPANKSDKRAWLRDVQTKLNGYVYEACYRNKAEQAMLDKIQRDYVEIQSNKNVQGYEKPKLLYDYPKTACGAITVKEDRRSSNEKQADAKLENEQKKLGTYQAPAHRSFTFQIVGLKYAQPYTDYTKGAEEFVKSLLVSRDDYSTGLEIPTDMYNSLPTSMKFDDIVPQSVSTQQYDIWNNEDFASRVLEFSTVAKAREFLNNETCTASDAGCNKQFIASPYGSNYLILDDLGALFQRIVSIAFPALLAFAAVIIWFTVSRIMAENRKETAVYRAMGARRKDVTQIYGTYVLFVAAMIAVVSLVLGVSAAYVLDVVYGKTINDAAATTLGVVDGAPTFTLFRLDTPLLGLVVASIFAVAIIASIQPLIRNARRSPIRDMREE